MMECPKCGTKLLPMMVHREDECEKQQTINHRNLAGGTVPCKWCGAEPDPLGFGKFHKDGCPRKAREG